MVDDHEGVESGTGIAELDDTHGSERTPERPPPGALTQAVPSGKTSRMSQALVPV